MSYCGDLDDTKPDFRVSQLHAKQNRGIFSYVATYSDSSPPTIYAGAKFSNERSFFPLLGRKRAGSPAASPTILGNLGPIFDREDRLGRFDTVGGCVRVSRLPGGRSQVCSVCRRRRCRVLPHGWWRRLSGGYCRLLFSMVGSCFGLVLLRLQMPTSLLLL